MKHILIIVLCLLVLNISTLFLNSESTGHKPSAMEVIKMLQTGNENFYKIELTHPHPHINRERLELAGTANQADYAYATVLSCSDSRVPVELIFDAGIMDIFVVRVAGNVCNADECGSIEYGLAHVNTPVLVVLGHTQCGAVTTATKAVQEKVGFLEGNIPPLLHAILPAVITAHEKHPDVHGDDIIPYAIEENVYRSIHDLFMKSATTRRLVVDKKVIVVGAIYDVGTGKITWLPLEESEKILQQVLKNSERNLWVQRNRDHVPYFLTGWIAQLT